MLQLLLYLFILFFFLLYFLRGLLMAGYENLQHKNNYKKSGPVVKSLVHLILTLKPLFHRKLKPKGVDYKIYERFQKKAMFYYTFMWMSLFIILFLAAKIYLNAF